MNVFSTLNNNRTESVLDESECSKESSGSLAHNHYPLSRRDIGIMRGNILGGRRFFVDKNPDSEIYIHGIMAGIDAALDYSQSLDGACIYAFFAGNIFLYGGYGICNIRQLSNLIFVCHRCKVTAKNEKKCNYMR